MTKSPLTTELWCLVRLDMKHSMGPLPTKEQAIKAAIDLEHNTNEKYVAVPLTFFGIKLPDEPTDETEWRGGGYL